MKRNELFGLDRMDNGTVPCNSKSVATNGIEWCNFSVPSRQLQIYSERMLFIPLNIEMITA